MNNLQKIIVQNLISNCHNNFTFDIRDVKHRDQESINNFCEVVKKEIKEKENVDIEVEGVKNVWYNMRRKFVKINLEKFRRQKISDTHEEFYQYLIFLENYISHKEDSVYISLNQKEVQQRVYDYLMGHTYEEQHEKLPEQPYEKPHEEQHKEPHEEPKEVVRIIF